MLLLTNEDVGTVTERVSAKLMFHVQAHVCSAELWIESLKIRLLGVYELAVLYHVKSIKLARGKCMVFPMEKCSCNRSRCSKEK
jgi:hypothetical protein